MRHQFVRIIIVCLICFYSGTVANANAMPDLGFESGGIMLSKPVDELVKGERVTVYVSLYNHGSVDATGYLVVEQGPIIVATKEITLAGGSARKQYNFSYTVPNGSFNLMARLLQISPTDKDAANNQILSPVFQPLEALAPAIVPAPVTVAVPAEEKVVAPPTKVKPVITPPVKKVVPVKTPSASQAKAAKLVESVYLIPETVQLDTVGITTRRIDWRTYEFTLTSNLPTTEDCALSATWDFGSEKLAGCKVIYHFADLGDHYVVVKVLGPWGNHLYATTKVNVNFFVPDNYWLWGFVLLLMSAAGVWRWRIAVPKVKKSGIIIKTESIENIQPVKVSYRPKVNHDLRTFHPRTVEL